MIKTSKQLGIAQRKLNELEHELQDSIKHETDINGAKYKMGYGSFNSLIYNLKEEIEEYRLLKSKGINTIKTNSIEDLPQLLIKSRIAKNMSQTDLANILETDVQQIQRYETTDYESASWTRMVEVILALDVKIKMEKVIVGKLDFDKCFSHPENMNDEVIKNAENMIRKTSLLNI